AIPASAPGIIAPNSCPKLPRIPQPRESDTAASVTNDQRRRRSVVCSIACASAHLGRSLFHRREEAGREALHSAEVGADLIFGRAAGAEGRLRLVTDREDLVECRSIQLLQRRAHHGVVPVALIAVPLLP